MLFFGTVGQKGLNKLLNYNAAFLYEKCNKMKKALSILISLLIVGGYASSQQSTPLWKTLPDIPPMPKADESGQIYLLPPSAPNGSIQVSKLSSFDLFQKATG
jgi:hypothetical protein